MLAEPNVLSPAPFDVVMDWLVLMRERVFQKHRAFVRPENACKFRRESVGLQLLRGAFASYWPLLAFLRPLIGVIIFVVPVAIRPPVFSRP